MYSYIYKSKCLGNLYINDSIGDGEAGRGGGRVPRERGD